MSTSSYWGLRDIAEHLGVEYSSARTYHGRSEIHRREGKEKPGDMPAPDDRFGNSPVWLKDRILAWVKDRPGKGIGGGRPVGVQVRKMECPVCHRRVGITKDGYLYNHKPLNLDGPDQDNCPGSRMDAEEIEDPAD